MSEDEGVVQGDEVQGVAHGCLAHEVGENEGTCGPPGGRRRGNGRGAQSRTSDWRKSSKVLSLNTFICYCTTKMHIGPISVPLGIFRNII